MLPAQTASGARADSARFVLVASRNSGVGPVLPAPMARVRVLQSRLLFYWSESRDQSFERFCGRDGSIDP